MFDKSKMDILEELLQEFQDETTSKRKDSPIEPIIHKQFKVWNDLWLIKAVIPILIMVVTF